MKENNATNEAGELKVLGIDLAKQSIQLHGVDGQGLVILRMKPIKRVYCQSAALSDWA